MRGVVYCGSMGDWPLLTDEARILAAAPKLPAVIYKAYYGFETKAELFFELRNDHPNLVGFKEFGGSDSLSYAAEH